MNTPTAILGSCCFALSAAVLAIIILAVRDSIRRRQQYRQLTCPHCGRKYGLEAVREGEERGLKESHEELLAAHPEFWNLDRNTVVDLNLMPDFHIACPACGKLSKFDADLRLKV